MSKADLMKKLIANGIAKEEDFATQQAPQEDSFIDDTVDVVAEFASSINRTIGEVVDFFGPDTANAILSLTEKGIGKLGGDVELPRVPTSKDIPGIEGGFMDPGLARDVTRASGQTLALGGSIGAIGRKAATLLPTQFAGESLAVGTARQLAGTTLAQDVTLGALSGVGAELGESVAAEQGEEFGGAGALVGSLAVPLAASGGAQVLTKMIGSGVRGFNALTRELSELSEEGAAAHLAEAMVREGLGPVDIAKRLKELGPEGLPADLGEVFANTLRNAANQIPRIQARISKTFDERAKGQSSRIMQSFDDASGTSSLNVDDQIIFLNKTAGAKADELYAAARAKDFKILSRDQLEGIGTGTPINVELKKISMKLKSMLGNKSTSIGRAALKTKQTLDDKRAMGDVIGDIDLIDATKKVMDDQIQVAIRAGRTNKVRDLVRAKNALVNEADKVVPEYKQARDFFAGKAQLENAAETGELFLKLKSREVADLVKTMSTSEKGMFILGAKKAIIDKLETFQTNSDGAKKLFGKGGDMPKLRSLFDDEKSFKQFADALEIESQFILTRNAARGNSTTAKQVVDVGKAGEIMEAGRALQGDPVASANMLGKIMGGLSTKKQTEAHRQALEKAGDILLSSGMNHDKLLKILIRADNKELNRLLERVLVKPSKSVAVAKGAAASQIEQRENP
jgi:hypothetical protein